jgi:hypothetical protein
MEASAMADQINFASDLVGSTPKGWTSTMTGQGSPRWTIEEDPTAPSKSKVVKQSGRATYPLLLKNGTSVKDGYVEIQFKAISGNDDRAAGIVWRVQDANNYYVVRANALEDNVNLYRVVKGRRQQLAGWRGKVAPNAWHALAIEARGDRLGVFWEGKPILDVRDGTFAEAGKVGVWTKADSVTCFDALTATPLG